MKKILVSGAEGQLGRSFSLIQKQYPNITFHFFGRRSLDITDKYQLNQIFEYHRPDYYINCAAYTAVDKAETDKDAAFLINQKAVGISEALFHIKSSVKCNRFILETSYISSLSFQ